MIFFDLDHTISDAAWRDYLINEEDWDTYHSMLDKDEPVSEVIEMVNALCSMTNVVGLTMRPEKWRGATNKWMHRNRCFLENIIMRQDNDYRKAAIAKVEIVKEWMKDHPGENVLVIDDSEKVVEAFIAEGITVLQIFVRRRNGNAQA